MKIEIEVTDDTINVLAEAIAARLPTVPGRQATSDYMTVAEAAEYLRCAKQRIYDLTSAQRLPFYKFGSRVLLSRDEIDAWLAERRVA
jgi:excisionase family DNA binding protein